MTGILDKFAIDDEGIMTELVQIGLEKAKQDFRYWQAIWDRFDGKVGSAEAQQPQIINYDDDPEPPAEQLD